MQSEYCKMCVIMSTAQNSKRVSQAEHESCDRFLVNGVLIVEFKSESSAKESGLEIGDVIVEYDGARNLTCDKLTTLTLEKGLDGQLTGLIFVRNRQERYVSVPHGPLGISAVDTALQICSESWVSGGRMTKLALWIQRTHLLLALLFFCGAVASFILTPFSWTGLAIYVLLWLFGVLCVYSDVLLTRRIWECKGGLLGAVIGMVIAEGISHAAWGTDESAWLMRGALRLAGVAVGCYLGYRILDRKTDQ
jgi:hypothetical protein